MIDNKINFIATCKNELQRFKEIENYSRITRSTEKGLRWAIEFAFTCGATLTDSEIKHAIRLMTFRGQTKPAYRN